MYISSCVNSKERRRLLLLLIFWDENLNICREFLSPLLLVYYSYLRQMTSSLARTTFS